MMMSTKISLSDKILKILEEKYESSGGHCGVYGAELVNLLSTEWKEVRNAIKPLYKDKKIKVSPGSRGNLFLINRQKHIKTSRFHENLERIKKATK